MPSWEETSKFVRNTGLSSVRVQRDYLIEVWSRAERNLRHEVMRRSNLPSLNSLIPATAGSGRNHRSDDHTGLTSELGVDFHNVSCVTLWRSLEDASRKSLERAVDAFNFLEDTDLADLSHQHAHKVAAMVGGLFGCKIEYSDGTYWDTCRLSLMHHRWGMSAGFTAARKCSLCGEDIDLCNHILDEQYEVQVQRSSDGTCSVCGSLSCSHRDGEVVMTYPHPVLSDFELHEVSMVARPRDPLARVTKMEFNPAVLSHSLGVKPNGRAVRCYRCTHPCGGLLDMEQEIIGGFSSEGDFLGGRS